MKNNGIVVYIVVITIFATLTIISIPKLFSGEIKWFFYTTLFLGLTILSGVILRKYRKFEN